MLRGMLNRRTTRILSKICSLLECFDYNVFEKMLMFQLDFIFRLLDTISETFIKSFSKLCTIIIIQALTHTVHYIMLIYTYRKKC